jgi:hypothetical protein
VKLKKASPNAAIVIAASTASGPNGFGFTAAPATNRLGHHGADVTTFPFASQDPQETAMIKITTPSSAFLM